MTRDTRTYITLVDDMPEHPKVEPLSDAAFRLLVETWCWCSRQKTDGLVRVRIWERRGTAETRQELVEAGLAEFLESGDVQMHDYLRHQRSAEQIAAQRSVNSENGRKGGLAKAKRTASESVANRQPVASEPLGESVSESVSENLAVSVSVPVSDQLPSEASTLAPEKDAPAPTKRATRLPEDWLPEQRVREAIVVKCPDVDLRYQHEQFHLYWRAKSGKDATKQDWSLTWQSWMLREQQRAAPSGRPRTNRQAAAASLREESMARAAARDEERGE